MTFQFKPILAALLAASLLTACAASTDTPADTASGTAAVTDAQTESPTVPVTDAHRIVLDGDSATLNGIAVEVFDYTWHCDPSTVHDEVKNAPAEYHTGEAPSTEAAAYIDSDLPYYPLLPEEGFKKVKYDGETEWAYYYTDGENGGYIFATLPDLGRSLPTQMMHSADDAAANRVLHITKPGTYSVEGTWNGQIRVDLGDEDETFTDPEAKITLILNGVNVKCTVAPAIIFGSAYECDNEWESRDTHTADVDTSGAGVTVVIADGTDNTFDGQNVYRMLKTKYKDEDSTDAVKTQKKQRKTDAAFYSYVTMNIEGGEENTGKLNVISGFEGLDSELHLSLNGGIITVDSQDDGINVNEDNVSVVILNGADVTLNPAQGAEGDGIDSNGFVVINSGTLSVNGVRVPDSAIDSEDGITYNGGTVKVDGTEQTLTPGSVTREIGGRPDEGQGRPWMIEDFDLADFKAKVAALPDDATVDDVLAALGLDKMNDPNGDRPEMPNGETPPEMPNGGQTPPDMPNGGQTPPDMPNGETPPEMPNGDVSAR